MIDFETPKPIKQINTVVETVAVNMMRPVSRYFDEHEHEIPWDYINFMHQAIKSMGGTSMAPDEATENGERKKDVDRDKKRRPPIGYQRLAHLVEMLAWGDAGMYLCIPGGLLGSAAVAAAGTSEQKKRFLPRLTRDKPAFDAMAMTEPQAGSDTSAIRAMATLDKSTNEWVLNGEKIFVTAGHKAMIDSDGFTVIWASIDPSAGRAGSRPRCRHWRAEPCPGARPAKCRWARSAEPAPVTRAATPTSGSGCGAWTSTAGWRDS